MNADVAVRDVMDREYLGVSESDDLVETVELLLREGLDTAVVLRGGAPVGVLTPRDVMSLVVEGPAPETATVGDAMTASVQTVEPEVGLRAAADTMSTHDVRRLVVTANGEDRPEGVISEHDVFAVQATDVDPGPTPEPGDERVTTGPGAALAADAEAEAGTAGDFEEQGICEACGTLTSDLVSFNGQLLCADCRDM